MGLFARDQAVEDGQDALAVLIDAVEVGAEGSLEIFCLDPFIGDAARHVDVLTERIERMAAQKQAVEKCGLALRREWIGIVPHHHFRIG